MAIIWYILQRFLGFFGTDYFFKEHQSFYPDYSKKRAVIEILACLVLYITFLLLKALPLVPAVSVKFYIRVAKIRNTYQNMWLSSS